ncbi:MAG: hypothetical protein HQK79_23055 [Desulfobacterales bacterium]|nr:hypothetical protein [Desulfobacterales bacterium]
MTPNEILEEVKGQFQVLYIKDDNLYEILLKKALGVFQNRAGVIASINIDEKGKTEIDMPEDFLSIVTVCDENLRYHESIVTIEKIKVKKQASTIWPLTIHYFVNLRDYNFDKDLPKSVNLSLFIEYLTVIIETANTARAKEIFITMGISAQTELPSIEELKQRKDNIESIIDDSQAILPPILVM